ncbi:MAG: hypothetical protein BM563_02780 [Bacteroidetes bacterium MedPE-SWsnd-G1]|nr:MAG: hypothetical protein BM563_02780 [Bacteroidetes bacterium MedPE-SWsnd-G1]
MKKSWVYFVLLLLCSFSLGAQTPEINDVILKTNGEEMIGKVQSISDNDVHFVYQNESIDYTVKVADIVKITFSSGRIQFFNKFDTKSKPDSDLASHHNKVAVLPFGFIRDQEFSSDQMSSKIQEESYDIFDKYSSGLQFQEPRTTNALLIKAGVQNNNIDGYTMGEICNILGVEFVIQGIVTVQKTNQSNVGSSTTTSKSKGKPYVDSHGHIVGDIFGNGKSKSTSFGVSTNIQNYSTSIRVHIYNDKGNSIFNKDHTSFWNTQDAYKITLKYLAKHSPFYKK